MRWFFVVFERVDSRILIIVFIVVGVVSFFLKEFLLFLSYFFLFGELLLGVFVVVEYFWIIFFFRVVNGYVYLYSKKDLFW